MKNTKLYIFLMTILIISFLPPGTSFQGYCQQSTFYIGEGVTCEVQADVDICVDTIIVHGSFIMNGTFCLMPSEIVLTNIDIPKVFKLYNNYPNPFNPVTQIKFDLPRETSTKLIVYDINGQELVKLVDRSLPAGSYQIVFDASALSSGTYFYNITADKYTDVKKMILVK